MKNDIVWNEFPAKPIPEDREVLIETIKGQRFFAIYVNNTLNSRCQAMFVLEHNFSGNTIRFWEIVKWRDTSSEEKDLFYYIYDKIKEVKSK